MKLPLPIKPAAIPSAQWDIFLERYYIPYLQVNYVRISEQGISQKDIIYFTEALDDLEEKYYGLSGLGQWGALIGGIISAIPSAIGAIANYKLGKSTLKLQKEDMESRRQREAADAAARQAVITQQATQTKDSTISRAIETVSEYSPLLLIGGVMLIGAIFLLKRR